MSFAEKWVVAKGLLENRLGNKGSSYAQIAPRLLKKNVVNLGPEKSPVREPGLVALFIRPLEKTGIRYLVTGSLGAMHYSEPRLTLDVDIPILITP